MNIKKFIFYFKLSHDLKKFKGYKGKNFRTGVNLYLLKICVTFLEKVTRNKRVEDKKS